MTLAVVRAFVRRDAQVAWSYRFGFVLDAVSVVFTLVTFRLVSRVVGSGVALGGYFAFVTVGLALSGFLQAGVSMLAGNLRQEQVQGTLEATLSCGLPLPVLAAGLAGYPMVSSAVRAAVFVAAAALLGARVPLANWPLGITAAVLGSISFVGLGLIGASFVLLFRQAVALTGWLVTTLGLAAGVLFPPRLLPGWARWMGTLSPFTHTLRIVRDSILTGSSWSSSGGSLALLGGLALLYALGGVLALGASLHRTKRTGGVSQY